MSSEGVEKVGEIFFPLLFLCVYVGEGHSHTTVCKGETKDSLQEFILSFHHVGSWDQAQIIRLNGRPLCSVS